MAIDDNTVYGLYGSQIKDLPNEIASKIGARVKTNAGAPTTSTTGTVGQLLEDTTNGKLYICTAASGGTYTWVEVGAGSGVDVEYVNLTVTGMTANEISVSADKTNTQIYDASQAGKIVMAKLSIPSQVGSFQPGDYYMAPVWVYSVAYMASGIARLSATNTTVFTYTQIGAQTGTVYLSDLQAKISATNMLSADYVDSASTTSKLYLTGSSDPTTSTVGGLGQLYVNRSTGAIYMCSKIETVSETTTYTWMPVVAQDTFYGSCTSSASATVKDVTCPEIAPEEGKIVYIGFQSGNTASPIYIQFNGTGTQYSVADGSGITLDMSYKIGVKQFQAFMFVKYSNNTGLYLRPCGPGLASTTYYGITKLSDSTSDTSSYIAATSKAVKTAYDLANGKQDPLTAGANITISNGTISATDTTYSAFTGATSSAAGSAGLVPAPTTSDPDKFLKGDGTWSAPLVEMSYGEANAWAKFIAAYNAGSIVYCRASSNSNPATGSQTRKAFMAYVNNDTTPTEVEFQYVRSVSSKTASQPVDQVFVYKLTSASGGTWTVESRNMAPKLASGTNTNVSYSSGTYTISATDTTYSDFTGATSSVAGAHGLVPAPTTSDADKYLKGDGTWGAVSASGDVFTTNEWNALWA